MFIRIFGKISEHALTLMLGGFVGLFFFTTAEIEYTHGYRESYFNIPEKGPENLVITYGADKRKIENISVYDYAIHNRTFKELKDVVLYFKFAKRDGKPIPKLISGGLYPPTGLPEKVGIEDVKTSDKSLYAYKIKAFKRTGSEKTYVARFIFEGNSVPEITLSAPVNVGVDVKPYSKYREYLALFAACTFLSVFFWAFFTFLDGVTVKKPWMKRRSKLKKILEEKLLSNGDYAQIENIMDEYSREFEPKMPFIHRKINGLKSKLRAKGEA